MQITFEADVHDREHLIRLRDELETCLRMVEIAIGNADKLKKGKDESTKEKPNLSPWIQAPRSEP